MKWLLPPDHTFEEKEIAVLTMESIYSQFNDPLDKLIIAMCFELDYNQRDTARLIGKNRDTVSLRIKKIKTTLMKTHKRFLKTDNPEDKPIE